MMQESKTRGSVHSSSSNGGGEGGGGRSPPSPRRRQVGSSSSDLSSSAGSGVVPALPPLQGGENKTNAAVGVVGSVDDDNDDGRFDDSGMGGDVELKPLRPSDHGDVEGAGSEADEAQQQAQRLERMGESASLEYENRSGVYRCLSRRWYEWVFPPNVPRPCQLMRKENLAVPACYLTVGLLQGLSGPFINVYPLDLGATEAQQTTISSLRSLPASLKLAFGFLSDTVPLCGFRRKSYMFLGWFTASISMFALNHFSDVTLSRAEGADESEEKNVVSENAPSIPFLSFALLMFGTGFWVADVMADSVVAEKAKLEPESTRGQLQSTCYACRFFGLMVAAPISTQIYSQFGPQVIVFIMAILPLAVLPLVYNMWEPRHVAVAPVRDQCHEIWTTVCSRAVWQPMGFVYLYNILQVGNSAWREFLRSVLGFTAKQLNILFIAGCFLLYVGIMAYKYYFIKWSWRAIYIWTTLFNGLLSMLQVLLILGITFGLSPFMFALGDDVFADILAGIQFLPTTIMMVQLCPVGSEGASYAMFTTVNNSALTLASAISTQMLGIWDVSKETMVGGDLSGMTKLTVLTTLIQTSGVLFVKLLPRSKADLTRLHADPMSGSKVGGFIFLCITILSILYSVVVGILNVVMPGWAGESR